MTATTTRCTDRPPLRHLGRLNSLLLRSNHPAQVWSSDPRRFHATLRSFALGAVTVTEIDCSPCVMLRTTRLIQRSDPQLYSVVLVLVLDGRLEVVQAGRKASVSCQEFTVYDSSHPVGVRAPGPGRTAFVRVRAPLALLPEPVRRLDRIRARRLCGREGVGALLATFVTGLGTLPPARHRSELGRLDATALDLLATTFAHHLGAAAPGRDPSGHERLLQRVGAYVQRHAGDPDLSPRAVAAAHHISVGYLHRLLRAGDTTVTTLIRDRRLAAARRDLSDLQLAGVPIHRIAQRSGFRDHTALTRAFRTVYGITPRDFRDGALRPGDAAP